MFESVKDGRKLHEHEPWRANVQSLQHRGSGQNFADCVILESNCNKS